jgi:putative flavoprotein involved in K+ transport
LTASRTCSRAARRAGSIPGLYFVGLPWQHTRGSALLGFVKDDAEYVSGALVQRHDSGAQAGVGASPSAPTG